MEDQSGPLRVKSAFWILGVEQQIAPEHHNGWGGGMKWRRNIVQLICHSMLEDSRTEKESVTLWQCRKIKREARRAQLLRM